MSDQAPWEDFADTPPWQDFGGNQSPAQGVKPRPAGGGAPPVPRGKTAAFLRSLGLSVRPAVQAAGSTVGMVGDALNTAINLGGRAIGHDPQLAMPSRAIQSGIDSVLPTPENTKERVVDTLATMGYGAMGADPLANAIAKRVPAPLPPVDTPRKQAIRAAQQEGFVVTPDQVPGSGLGSRLLESVGGKKQLRDMARVRNQDVANAVARREAGLPPNTPLTGDVLDQAMNAAYEQGYKPLEQMGDVRTGKTYKLLLERARQQYGGTSGSFPDAANTDVEQLVAAHRVPQFNAKDAVNQIRVLRDNAKDAYRLGKSQLGGANRAVSDAIERNLEFAAEAKGQPGLLDAYRNARTAIAKQNVVADALREGTGDVNAVKFGSDLQKGVPLTGGLQTMGAFANAAKPLVGIPTEASPTSSLFRALSTGLPPVAAGAVMGPHAAAAAATIPFIRGAIRQGLLSKCGQKMLSPTLTPGIVEQLLTNPAFQRALPAMMMHGGGLFSGVAQPQPEQPPYLDYQQ